LRHGWDRFIRAIRPHFLRGHGRGQIDRFGKETQSGVEDLPCRNAPNIVGEVYGLTNLPVAEAGFSRFTEVVLGAGHAVAAQGGAERNEFPFASAEFFHVSTLPFEFRVYFSR
jgi:hypothetical protein